MKEERPVFVVGHKNPDTDSVCAAIAYARLKTIITGKAYEPRRAGHLNEETSYVLDRFEVDKPLMLTDVRTQVKDLEIRDLAGAAGDTSLKDAWEIMRNAGVVTVCVTKDDQLQGIITTNVENQGVFEMRYVDFGNQGCMVTPIEGLDFCNNGMNKPVQFMPCGTYGG